MNIVSRAWGGFNGAATSFATEVLGNIRGVIILAFCCIGIGSVLAGFGIAAPVGLACGAAGAWALSW